MPSRATSSQGARRPGNRGYALLLGLLAAILLLGGGRLLLLGGSAYYAAAGVALAGVAGLSWRGDARAAWLYGGIVVATVGWSLFEVGADGWALMPRIVAWLVVGAWMLTPHYRRDVVRRGPADAPPRRLAAAGVLTGALAVAAAIGGTAHRLQPQPFDPRFQTGFGAFPEWAGAARDLPADGAWPEWGGDAAGRRFSPLTQLTPANVAQLAPAWSTDLARDAAGRGAGLEAVPIMIGDTLYLCNGRSEALAIDAESGRIRWQVTDAVARGQTCRGVAFYRVPDATGMCAERILWATGAAGLVALDARTGRRCAGFGRGGRVDLLAGMSRAPAGYYHVTSAPTIVRGRAVVGGWVSDGQYWGEPSGVIRAFDARTGALAWAWDMGRPDRRGAPPAGETYMPATPNSWAPMSADEALGLVYVPTGNATPDYVGTRRRPFDERYSSSVVALDAATGRPHWSFQTVHHDVWDYDVGSQPVLAEVPDRDGRRRLGLIQTTKRGEIFVLDRTTGRPLRPVRERPVPQRGKAPEERLSPTQPFSDAMPSFRNPPVRETDMWGLTPLDQLYCRIRFREARFDGVMTPPGTTPAIQAPGYIGGMDWGSAAIDADRGVMIVGTTKLANRTQLVPRTEARRLGIAPVGADARAIEVGASVPQIGTPYAARVSAFLSPLFVPCQAPPYGYLSAIDLASGRLIWSHPLGSARDSGPLGIGLRLPIRVGTPLIGGAIVTRGGVAFIAATNDRTLRAVDVRSGQTLWEGRLPAGGFSTPITYLSRRSGRQFVVIAAGGAANGLGLTGEARLVAFALPRLAPPQ